LKRKKKAKEGQRGKHATPNSEGVREQALNVQLKREASRRVC
jgi:hypothetical protein